MTKKQKIIDLLTDVGAALNCSYNEFADKLLPLLDDEPLSENVKIVAQFIHKNIKPLRTKGDVVYISPQAAKKIEARLKTYKLEEIIQALTNFKNDEWRMKNNAHNGLEWYFKNDEQIIKFLDIKGKNEQTESIVVDGTRYNSKEEFLEAERRGEIIYYPGEKAYRLRRASEHANE